MNDSLLERQFWGHLAATGQKRTVIGQNSLSEAILHLSITRYKSSLCDPKLGHDRHLITSENLHLF